MITRTSFVRDLSDSLSRLAASPDGQKTLELVQTIGDAIRISAEIPSSLRQWARTLTFRELAPALIAATASVSRVLASEDGDPADAVIVRDEVQSVMQATSWICLTGNKAPADVPGLAELATALRSLDERLTETVSYETADEALGPRRFLQDVGGWTGLLRSHAEHQEIAAPRVLIGTDLPAEAGPSEAVVSEYIEHGRHREWVEQFAAHSEEFRDVLLTTIDVMKEMREGVGLVARRFEMRAKGDVGALVIPIRRAAAEATTELLEDRFFLGQFPPFNVSGQLSFDAEGAIHLLVTDMGRELQRVEFESEALEEPDPQGCWRLSAACATGPLRIVVLGRNGHRFEENILVP